MIVDSSAVVAIVLGEADAPQLISALLLADRRRMSVANWLEAALVVDGRGDDQAAVRFDDLMADLDIELVPFSAPMAQVARTAHRRFGKGRHPARLNFGDCFAYALAKTANEPLLFKGNDFDQTDVTPALP